MQIPKPHAASIRFRVLAGLGFLLVGCVLPYVAEHWFWSPIQLEVVNGLGAVALEQVEIESDDGVQQLGGLSPGARSAMVLHAHSGIVRLRVRHAGDREGRLVELRSCCRSRIQLVLGGTDAPQYRTVEEPGAWAALVQ